MAKARLFWHIFITDKTPAIVAEQLYFIERQPYPVTAVITWKNHLDHLINTVFDLLHACKKVDVIMKQPAAEYEFDTLKTLYVKASKYDFVGYFHTKGAVMQSPNTRMWRNLMGFYTVRMAEEAVNDLKTTDNDFVGAFGTNGAEGQKPFIGGNFWWARSSYILKLPYPKILPHFTRYDCECWIGLENGKMKTYLDLALLDHSILDIAEKYDTDKKAHGYFLFYELYLATFRNSAGKLLEIGDTKKETLSLWQAVLPKFIIEGLNTKENPEAPKKIYNEDPADRTFLSKLPDYDIIIDDGGHRSKQQIITLVSKVQNTCLYVIEDLHTSQPELYANYHDPGEITCLDYLTQYPNLKPDYISLDEHERLKGKGIFMEEGVVSPIVFIM